MTETHREGGFKCVVSHADGDLSEESADAFAFLTRHIAALDCLRNIPQVTNAVLDFGYWLRIDGETVTHSDRLPSELSRLAGDLRIAIELTLYPPPREGWEHADEEMIWRGEDALLDPPSATQFDKEEWDW